MVHLLATGCILLLHVHAPSQVRERPIEVDLITPPRLVPEPLVKPQPVAIPVPVSVTPPPPTPARAQPPAQTSVRVEQQPFVSAPFPAFAPAPGPAPLVPPAEALQRPASPIVSPASASAAPLAPPAPPVPTRPPSVVPPSFDADYLHNPTPRYPPAAARLRESGRVLLSVAVNAAGLPERVEIASSSGSPRLDQAALETVRRWRFVPARQGDQPVAATVTVPLVFRLEE